jgi:hypothetical protein
MALEHRADVRPRRCGAPFDGDRAPPARDGSTAPRRLEGGPYAAATVQSIGGCIA